jgi:membrane-bound inhibitor of C-type lysozyme
VRPPSGSFTYTCQGGTLVVNYISSNQVRLFYDGAFQTLPLVRSGAELVYSNNIYTWEIGQVGRLIVRGQVVLSNCSISFFGASIFVSSRPSSLRGSLQSLSAFIP